MAEKKQKPNKKCFVMMPISTPEGYEKDHFDKVYKQIICPAIERAGYVPFRVDEDLESSSITTKIINAIIDCDMAVCDLSSRNPNVLYELGMRQAFDKPVVLIQDDFTERIFDISVINTITYERVLLYDKVLETQESIRKSIIATAKANTNSIVRYANATKADSTISDDRYDKNSDLLEQTLSKIDRISFRLDTIENGLFNTQSDKNRLPSPFHKSVGKRSRFEIKLKPLFDLDEIAQIVEKYEGEGCEVYESYIDSDMITLTCPYEAIESKLYFSLASELGTLMRIAR